ncbi:hypothetical protein [Brevundimonas sp. FT23042]|uniref:hypothetical protein n=1 Tax=Brevundimonas sp. FT23042 TaxID=3393749 RepID=UPI003B58921B
MIGWLAPVLAVSASVCWAIALCLIFYLSLRLDALKRSGNLPPSTPEIFTLGFRPWGGGMSINILELYSRRYREVDGHTRRFVPIIRVLLPLAPVLLVLVFLANR